MKPARKAAPLRVLLVAGGYPPRSVAGMELHVRLLARALPPLGHEALVYTRAPADDGALRFLDERVEGVPVRWVLDGRPRGWLAERADPEIDADFERHVEALRPDLVHIHHLLGLSTGLPAVLSARGLPYVVTLHDYWFACARVRLLYRGRERCTGPEEGALCESCFTDPQEAAARRGDLAMEKFLRGPLGAAARVATRLPDAVKAAPRALLRRWARDPAGVEEALRRELPSFRERHRAMQAILAGARAVVSPSEHLARRMREFGLAGGNLCVVRYGHEFTGAPRRERRARADEPLAVVYLGTLSYDKGLDLAVRAFRLIEPAQATLTICGRGDPAYVRELRSSAEGLPHVRFHGPYLPEDLPRLLAKQHVLLFCSRWEENAPHVIQEAFHHGLAVITADGAGEEFVRDGVSGLVYRHDDPEDLARTVRRLAATPGLETRLAAGAPAVRTARECAEELAALYRRVVR